MTEEHKISMAEVSRITSEGIKRLPLWMQELGKSYRVSCPPMTEEECENIRKDIEYWRNRR